MKLTTLKKVSGLAAMFLIVLLHNSAWATKYVYPGAAPCDQTLQKCIDGVNDFDIILVAVGQVDEDLTIQKSLTLTTVPGQPDAVIGGGAVSRTIHVDDSLANPYIILTQLNFANAHIDVQFVNYGGSFSLLESTVSTSGNVEAVSLKSGKSASFEISRNKIIAGIRRGIALICNSANGNTALIQSNVITAGNPNDSLGGIYLNFLGTGTSDVRVRNNIVYSVASANNTNIGGIKILSQIASTNHLFLWNNTIDQVNSGPGIFFATPDLGSTLTAQIVNNIVTNTAGDWLQLPPVANNVSIQYGENSYFNAGNSGLNGHSGGLITNQNPGYINASTHDYRLNGLSPCINAGLDSFETGLYDAFGHARLIGSKPDQGAIESLGDLFFSYTYFSDDFDDDTLDPNFLYLKGAVSEDGRNLIEYDPQKATVFLPDDSKCSICTIDVGVKQTGIEIPGKTPVLYVTMWYKNSKNYIDLVIQPEAGKALLRQKVNGRFKRKDTLAINNLQFYPYWFRVKNTGTQLILQDQFNQVKTVPLRLKSAGIFGFQSKATYGYLTDITIHK